MMKIQITLITSLFALFLMSCEEVIEIDLNSSDPVVVAEGMIMDDSLASLMLSYSSDYFDVEESEKISDAVVRISDDAGNSTSLNALGGGRYEAPLFLGIPGRSYTMTFEFDDFSYEASSTLMTPTKIMAVSYEKMELGFREQMAETDYYLPTIQISDNPHEDNYYRFKFFVDGEEQDAFFLVSDRNATEGKLEYTPLRMAIEGGNEVKVLVYSIDEATYDYYYQLDDLNTNMMDSSTPYNPISNFGAEVMGFFTALSSDSNTSIISSEEE